MTARPDEYAETCAKLAAFSQWLDDSYPPGMDAELVMRRRTDKVGVEFGEVGQAIEAWTGENPRKGVTGTVGDVIKELLDTANAALGAVEHLTGNNGRAFGMLVDHLDAVCERAGVSR